MPPNKVWLIQKWKLCEKIQLLTLDPQCSAVTNQNLVFRLKGLFLSNKIPDGLHPGANEQEHGLELSTDPAIQWKLWLIYLRIHIFYSLAHPRYLGEQDKCSPGYPIQKILDAQ